MKFSRQVFPKTIYLLLTNRNLIARFSPRIQTASARIVLKISRGKSRRPRVWDPIFNFSIVDNFVDETVQLSPIQGLLARRDGKDTVFPVVIVVVSQLRNPQICLGGKMSGVYYFTAVAHEDAF